MISSKDFSPRQEPDFFSAEIDVTCHQRENLLKALDSRLLFANSSKHCVASIFGRQPDDVFLLCDKSMLMSLFHFIPFFRSFNATYKYKRCTAYNVHCVYCTCILGL